MAIALLAVELLHCQPESARAAAHFTALARDAAKIGITVRESGAYRGTSDWVLLWGPGAPDRARVMRQHLTAGGHVLALDLAYWHRDTKLRLSIDAAHPSAWVMRKTWPASRWLADRVPTAEVWQPHGPIVIAGLGRKARTQYGQDTVFAWERSMIAACRARWPKRLIVYRRKQPDAPVPDGVAVTGTAVPIDQQLRGASLVITWHSNVAIDAIRMGVPVVCRDGAAAAVCPSELSESQQPLPTALRDQFLANLAWFQWTPAREGAACWRFVRELVA